MLSRVNVSAILICLLVQENWCHHYDQGFSFLF